MFAVVASECRAWERKAMSDEQRVASEKSEQVFIIVYPDVSPFKSIENPTQWQRNFRNE
jgi:hypothetical protein